MRIEVEDKLEDFLRERPKRFPAVTDDEKTEWIEDIKEQIRNMMDDTDIFYDNMPKSVTEVVSEEPQ